MSEKFTPEKVEDLKNILDENCNGDTWCIDTLQNVLNGKGTAEEILELKKNLENCLGCYQKMELEDATRELFNTYLKPKAASDNILQKIKQTTFQGI